MLICATGFILDIFSKALIRKFMPVNFSIPLLGSTLGLTHITNTGIAFGMAKGNNAVLAVVSISILILLMIFFGQAEKKGELLPLALIMAGAAGNIGDRIIFGRVCDFIELNLGFWPFNPWPIFNIADSLVTIGGVMLFYREFFKSKNCLS